jgi:hypothetical protein
MAISHVYPVSDTRPHNIEDGGQCDCGPKVEFLESGDTLVVHNAWDGREIFEELDAGAHKGGQP